MTAVYKNFDDGFEDNIEKIRWSQRCFGSYVVDAFHSIGYTTEVVKGRSETVNMFILPCNDNLIILEAAPFLRRLTFYLILTV